MTVDEIKSRTDPSEFRYSASRSSGPGGQNVNKVSSKVELRFNVITSQTLTDEEKNMIITLLRNRITNEGDLLIVSQSERTQLQNKKKAEGNLYKLLAKALTVQPERKETKPTYASRAKRIDVKKKKSKIKTLRKGPSENDF